MKIIEPKVEYWQQNDVNAHIARCARICYGKESGNDEVTIKNLIDRKHWSMFRHSTYYFIIDDTNKNAEIIISNFRDSIGFDYRYFKHKFYIVVNGNWALDNPTQFNYLSKFKVSIDEFKSIEVGFGMMRYTFCIVTQISTSRELNRVSPNNIAEQSTRYVYDNGSICCPHWIDINGIVYNSINQVICVYNKDNSTNNKAIYYLSSCEDAFTNYNHLIKHFGMHRQDARGVLPLDTATKCVYTYSIDEWRKIIDLRYYGTTGKPHENAKIIASMIRNELIKLGYDFRD